MKKMMWSKVEISAAVAEAMWAASATRDASGRTDCAMAIAATRMAGGAVGGRERAELARAPGAYQEARARERASDSNLRRALPPLRGSETLF
jgi:hypothetical protein